MRRTALRCTTCTGSGSPSQRIEVRRMSCRSTTDCIAPRYRSSCSRLSKAARAGQQIRIAMLGHQMMEKNAFLQRRQRVNVLHVGRCAGNARDDALDLGETEFDQRQHVGGQDAAIGGNSVGGARERLGRCPAPPLRAGRRWGVANKVRTSVCTPTPAYALDQGGGGGGG